MIYNVIAFSTLFFAIASIILYYRHRRVDSSIEKFYKSVDDIRDRVHSCKSLAEFREIEVEVEYLEETFSDLISDVILKKEIKLLRTLINKKNRKAK